MNLPGIIEFVTDQQLLNLTLSEAQATLLRAIYGMPLSPTQLDLFRACTGRQHAPSGGFGEVTVIAGARAGKDSRISAPIMCYEALFGGHEAHLSMTRSGFSMLREPERYLATGWQRGLPRAAIPLGRTG